jgi:DNA-binding MurR/RpiR family transcriptional regulator
MNALERQPVARALSKIDAVFSRVTADTADRMCDEILQAKRVAGYGVGREGLMIKALCRALPPRLLRRTTRERTDRMKLMRTLLFALPPARMELVCEMARITAA